MFKPDVPRTLAIATCSMALAMQSKASENPNIYKAVWLLACATHWATLTVPGLCYPLKAAREGKCGKAKHSRAKQGKARQGQAEP